MILFELSNDFTLPHLLCARPQRAINCQEEEEEKRKKGKQG